MVDGTKGGNLARFAEHLVDFACVKLLGIDHLPGILLDNDRVSEMDPVCATTGAAS
jgi:hypothetical protein